MKDLGIQVSWRDDAALERGCDKRNVMPDFCQKDAQEMHSECYVYCNAPLLPENSQKCDMDMLPPIWSIL